MESDKSDDDYEPITLGTWGQQQVENTSENYDTPTTEDEAQGWDALIDPNSVKKAGALGSGGLHRKGKNYKPVDEEAILQHRLKGSPLPKTNKANKEKTKKPRAIAIKASDNGPRFSQKKPVSESRTRSKPKPKKDDSTTVRSSHSISTTRTKGAPNFVPAGTVISSTKRPPPPPSYSGGWGAQPLVETPFWIEQQPSQPTSALSSSSPSHKNNYDTKQQQQQQQPQQQQQRKERQPQGPSWMPETLKKPPPGFDTITTGKVKEHTPSIPPGFDSIPQRRPSATTRPPLPGFEHTVTTPLRSKWQSGQDEELWKKLEKSTSDNKKRHSKAADNVDSTSEWVAGWDDMNLNHIETQKQRTKSSTKSPPPSSSTSSWGDTSWESPAKYTNVSNDQSQREAAGNRDSLSWKDSSSSKWAPKFKEERRNADSSPTQFLDEQTNSASSGRFSDPYRNRYSTTDMNGQQHPFPKNYYRKNGVSRPAFMETPNKVAPPPPSNNPIVVSIQLELENGTKIPVGIRKLDDPVMLTHQFCQTQNISAPNMIQAIQKLFTQQQTAALARYRRS